MSSKIISEKLKRILPSKNIFIGLFMFMLTITFSVIVALANENMVVVETAVLNVRYGPGLSHDVLTQVEENDRLFLLGEENKWYKVRLSDDQIGWVASWLVDSNDILHDDQQFAIVTADAVNIRQFSTTDSNIIGAVYKDSELQILYQEGDWYQVLYMGQVAWIHGDYVDIITTPSAAQADSVQDIPTDSTVVVIGNAQSTNIRSLASMDGEVIHTAGPGERFQYIESVGSWFHIRINENLTGYVADSVATLSTVETQAESVASQDLTGSQYARSISNISEATIVIDAGHGGRDSGAVSADNSIFEKDITLSTAILLRNRLQDAGANVILSRSSDEFVSLDDRVITGHNYQADLFISLHYDAIEVANSMSGTTTYYYSESNLELANTVNRYLAQLGPLNNNGVRHGNYYILRANNQPSILLELGYMNSDIDIQHIDTIAYQSTIVEAVYQALREYYGQ
ncbi:MAG TPA: N-acetylmuramoyl-L-alanine amidase [Atopostipes sp.]|nr:N-acetylmuramoyl-L-alanine amidase [Atopostipes sp.]